MYLSTVRLYHPALWKMLFTYRVILVTLRSFENVFHSVTYLFVRGPILMAWTRLPLTRDRKPPFWGYLTPVVAPIKSRASLVVGASQMGSNFAIASTTDEISDIQSAIVDSAKRPSRFWGLAGSYLRGYFTTLGPAFIKFGQILSMREELPPVIRNELALLQDKLPPMPFKQVRKILERELDRPLEEVFEYIEEIPIAAASLSQVHRAKLRKEQQDVALKIQRPYLHGTVALDTIYLCDIVIGLIQRLLPTMSKGADFGCFTTSYREQLAREIDFNIEERAQSRYSKRVLDHPLYSQAITVAKTYREYTTTKLLTMELIKNYHRLDRIFDELTPQQLWDFATTKLQGMPPEAPLQLLWIGMCIHVHSLSHWGLCHGDVHLGNIYALAPKEEGDHWRIFLCDFGMMIDETEPERMMALDSGLSFCYFYDGAIIGRAFAKQSLKPIAPQNRDKLIEHMARVVDKYFVEVKDGSERVWHPQVQRGTSVTVLGELTYGCATLGLKLSPYNWLMLKNFSYLANIGNTLWSSYNLMNMWAPHVKKYVKDVILQDLETKNVTNMKESLPQVFTMLRDHDRKEVLRALDTGEPVKPLNPVWADDWDVRNLSHTEQEH